jgi:hypothetical protein
VRHPGLVDFHSGVELLSPHRNHKQETNSGNLVTSINNALEAVHIPRTLPRSRLACVLSISKKPKRGWLRGEATTVVARVDAVKAESC